MFIVKEVINMEVACNIKLLCTKGGGGKDNGNIFRAEAIGNEPAYDVVKVEGMEGGLGEVG